MLVDVPPYVAKNVINHASTENDNRSPKSAALKSQNLIESRRRNNN